MAKDPLERAGLTPTNDAILYCPRERSPRQHRYQRTSSLPIDAKPDDEPTLAPLARAEIIYACRLCDHERLLAVLMLCGPRDPSPVRRPRGRPRKILL